MRMRIEGLSLKVRVALGRSPCDGTAYAFRNRTGNRIKLLVWDGTDGCIGVASSGPAATATNPEAH